jgi:hypothetical protein
MALNFARRAGRIGISEQERKFELGRAIGNFEYMLKNTKPDFVLRPEIHFQLGMIRLQLGDTIGAGREFQKAKRFKRRN